MVQMEVKHRDGDKNTGIKLKMQGCCGQQQDEDREIQPHVQARYPIPPCAALGSTSSKVVR